MRASYGVPFVNSQTDSNFASIVAMLYAMSRYTGTRLYLEIALYIHVSATGNHVET